MPAAECAAKGCCHAPSPPTAGLDAAVQMPTCFHANGGASSYAADGGTGALPAKGKLTQVCVRERVCAGCVLF